MSEPNEEDLGLDWLDKMVEGFQSVPIFEDIKWDRILAELGRISVYFEQLDFNTKHLLVTLEEPEDLTIDNTRYAHTHTAEVIKKCTKALEKMEPGLVGRQPAVKGLFEDCRQQLAHCDQLRERRVEFIHALWFPQAFKPEAVTRLRVAKPKAGAFAEIKPQEHDLAEPRALALEIRNAIYSLNALTIKLRVAFQQPTSAGTGS